MDYISVEHQKLMARSYKGVMLIVAVICASIIIYMLAARIVTPREMTPGSESWRNPVYTGVIVLGLIVVIARRLLMSKMFLGGAAGRGIEKVLSNLTALSVIPAAAAELIAVLGLGLYFLTGETDYSWRLGIVGLFLTIYSFPRRGEWVRAVAVAEGK
jgi:hypothetical protein